MIGDRLALRLKEDGHAMAHSIEELEAGGLPAWRLHDQASDMSATWVPPAGMLGASLLHHGEELLWQGPGVTGYARDGSFMGIPFLYPWANRLAGYRYQAGGHDIELDPRSPLLKLDPNRLPIHGLLTASSRWSVEEAMADGDGARLLASLEFDDPGLLSAFPFPHRVEMEVTVSGGELGVTTTVVGMGTKPVPVAFGFHPYLQIPGVPRSEWEVSFPVRRRLMTDDRMIPTGQTESVEPLKGPIGDRTWDDGFDRIDTPAHFAVSGAGRTIQVQFGAGYPVAQIYAPPGEQYICIEPMTAPTNALAGPDDALAWVHPGERWSAVFRIASTIG